MGTVVTVNSQIHISNPPQSIIEYCKTELTIANPAYQKAINAGRSVWKIPKEIVLYKRIGGNIVLPFGCLTDVFKMVRNAKYVDCTQHDTGNCEYGEISLYDYQQTAVNNAVKSRGGVVVAPCGAGKTQMGLAIVAALGGCALWLTHTGDLMRQSKERAESLFQFKRGDIGTITAGKVDIGNRITFSTIQTASKVDIPAGYFDCVIVDECHHCIGTPTQITMFSNVLNRVNARYKYGLTATPDRTDGLSRAMYVLLGDKCAEIPKSAVANKTVPFDVVWKETGYYGEDEDNLNPDGTINFTGCITAVCRDSERNKLIASDIENMDGATLVLTSRVEHCEMIYDILCNSDKKVARLSASSTKSAKAERAEALKKLNAGDIDVVIATYPLAREGLDCPNLRNLVMACPIKEKNTVIQSVGRVQRSAEGKCYGIVYDYKDSFSYFKSCAAIRNRIYKYLQK